MKLRQAVSGSNPNSDFENDRKGGFFWKNLLSKNYTYDLRTKMRSKLQIGFDIRIIVDSFLMVAAKSFLIKTRKSQRYHTQLQRN